MSYKINTWYKRTDVDYNEPQHYTDFHTHFFITSLPDLDSSITGCSKRILACSNPVIVIEKENDAFGIDDDFVECSQEEIDLLLNQQNIYEVY